MLVTPWAALGRKYYTEPVHQVHPWPALYFGCYDTVSWVGGSAGSQHHGACVWCIDMGTCIWPKTVYFFFFSLSSTSALLLLISLFIPFITPHPFLPPRGSQAVWLQRFRIGRRVWAQRFPCLAVICALQRQRLMGSGNRERRRQRGRLWEWDRGGKALSDQDKQP